LLLEIRKDLLHDLTNVNKPQRIGRMLIRGVAVFWMMGADTGHELSNGPLQRVEVNIWLHDVIDAMYLVIGNLHSSLLRISRGLGYVCRDVGTLRPGSLLLRGCGDPLIRCECPSKGGTIGAVWTDQRNTVGAADASGDNDGADVAGDPETGGTCTSSFSTCFDGTGGLDQNIYAATITP
jgi:hypothetical protein